MKDVKVFVYASRQQKKQEMTYLELGVVVFPLKIWRHCLYGAKFEVFIVTRVQIYFLSVQYKFEAKEVSLSTSGTMIPLLLTIQIKQM